MSTRVKGYGFAWAAWVLAALCPQGAAAADQWTGSDFFNRIDHLNYEARPQAGSEEAFKRNLKLLPKKSILELYYDPDESVDPWIQGIQQANKITPDTIKFSVKERDMIRECASLQNALKPGSTLAIRNANKWQRLSEKQFMAYKDAKAAYYLMCSYTMSPTHCVTALHVGIYDIDRYKSWRYPSFSMLQSKPLNPLTRKPWISLDIDHYNKEIEACKRGLSDAEKAYLGHLLFVLNENFHYFIGEPFVDFTDMKSQYAKLLAAYIPVKCLVFDKFEQFVHEKEAPLRREISRYLGRAVYRFDEAWDWDATEWLTRVMLTGEEGPAQLTPHVKLLDGQDAGPVLYHHYHSEASAMPGVYMRWGQVYRNPQFIYQMSLGLTRLMADNTVDTESLEGNESPMKKILYLINKQTQNYLDAYCSTDYIRASARRGTGSEASDFRGYKAMYELISLPKGEDWKEVSELDIMRNAGQFAWQGDVLGVSAALVARISPDEVTVTEAGEGGGISAGGKLKKKQKKQRGEEK